MVSFTNCELQKKIPPSTFIPTSTFRDLATFAPPLRFFQPPRFVKKIWWIFLWFWSHEWVTVEEICYNIQNSDLAEKMPNEYEIKSKAVKVRTFWEAHIIWKNLPHGFDANLVNQLICQNHEEDFFKFCVFLRKSEL